MAYIQNSPVLEVRNLSVSFQMNDGLYGQKMLQVISELNMKVHAGEILQLQARPVQGKVCLHRQSWESCQRTRWFLENCVITVRC